VNVSFVLAIGSAIVWGGLISADLFTLGMIGQPLREPAFVIGEAICMFGLALSLFSLWSSAHGYMGLALTVAGGSSLLAIMGVVVVAIMMKGQA
jgi:hypothetical protein